MCRPVTCKTCGKTTWAGCGQHSDDDDPQHGWRYGRAKS